MAKDFKALIRINDWELDQKRRFLGQLLGQLDNLEGRLAALEEEILREQTLAAQSPVEGGRIYGAFAAEAIKRREQIKKRIAEKEEEIVAAREVLRDAFLEVKKYEIAEEQRQFRVDRELAKFEQQELDEIGLNAYLRKE